MEFEFDDLKSEANKTKHGIDFVQAQELWNDPERVEVPVRSLDESRFVVIGKIGSKHWSGVIIYRGERVRLISVRRSRREEIEIYEG